jgi:hypothetical protein
VTVFGHICKQLLEETLLCHACLSVCMVQVSVRILHIEENMYISVQNNTLQSKQIFVFLVHTSSYVHHSRDLVPQGTRRHSDSQILRVQCVGVYVYIKLGQGESVVENCTWKILATLTHADHSSFLFKLLVGVCDLLHSVSFCCPHYLWHRTNRISGTRSLVHRNLILQLLELIFFFLFLFCVLWNCLK